MATMACSSLNLLSSPVLICKPRVRAVGPVVPCGTFMKPYRGYSKLFQNIGSTLSEELELTSAPSQLGYDMFHPLTEAKAKKSVGKSTRIDYLLELEVRAPESNDAVFKTIVCARPDSSIPDMTIAAFLQPGLSARLSLEMTPDVGGAPAALASFFDEADGLAILQPQTIQHNIRRGRVGFQTTNPLRDLPAFEKLAWSFTDTLCSHGVAVVLLPPLSTAQSPDAYATIGKLQGVLISAGIASIPSLEEYMAVSIKEVQYQLCDRLKLEHIPLKVITYTGSDSAADIEKALKDLPSAPGMSILHPRAQPGGYILKPGVGDCGSGLKQFNMPARRNALESLVQLMLAHMHKYVEEVRVWLLQPFFPTFPKAEYKVFVTPPPLHGPGSKGGLQALLVYTPIFKAGTSPVYCEEGQIFSELFGPDGMAVTPQYQTSLRGSRRQEPCHSLSQTWHSPKLHKAIREFATKCASAIASEEGLKTAGQVFLRADVVCFFEDVSDEDSRAYMVHEPVVVLNELDIIGSASLHLDLIDPGRDGLRQMRPHGSAIPVERHHCQKYWVAHFSRLLGARLFGDRVWREAQIELCP
ncbi:hypothetical protein KFL_005680030 [Klebsormidium nitens]|uniref:ATP-grasp domain-containing protein n=1 Tax=Klebsormidium nitens TaxID=105231 RepID=A0A1Y1IM22_KLENI|nr:hypothetical protein KFL_005680030 [Klebsormidium nitens]|eukprot:GAQ89836.1 hypothetical protein KFL_005680030 [Klebsormidium nitens]